MEQVLRIVFIASECVPFAKTGGLADVVGALPRVLRDRGHEVIVIIPKYAEIQWGSYVPERLLHSMGVWMGNGQEWCAVDGTHVDGTPIYFIEFDRFFQRPGLYHDSRFNDYSDNALRFGLFTRAALQLIIDLRFQADIVHVHDWQTALAPAYLKIWHWNHDILGRCASVLTIHNIAYQGVYPADCYEYLGLQWSNFSSNRFEDHGRVNFLKGGIQFSDMITTVSPKYARETRSPEFAHGMAPYLNDRGDAYVGILNGVDYSTWNPEIDPLIPAVYSSDSMNGKRVCKEVLQRRMGLEEAPDVPLFGVVSRFAEQKGLHLLGEALPLMLEKMQMQCIVLGSGDPRLERVFADMPARFPGRCGVYIGYHDELAHWIEAGCDGFIMPSIYEPCGLNQIYSLRYGTLPVVRATGGLDDTVEQYDESSGRGTGFKFTAPLASAVFDTVGWAVSTYYDRPHHFQSMQRAAMSRRFSWDDSVTHYLEIYREARRRKP
ncbi:glycogen synthase GlgA [bacterium]|nr:glycogen synthase GlgA [candidate division CSSED10-310 bacterium]